MQRLPAVAQFFQLILVESHEVGDLMDEGDLQFPLQFYQILEVVFQRVLIDTDHRRQIAEILHMPLRQRRAGEQTVNVGLWIAVHLVHQLWRGPVVDDDGHVVHGLPKDLGNAPQSALHQSFEAFAVHPPSPFTSGFRPLSGGIVQP